AKAVEDLGFRRLGHRIAVADGKLKVFNSFGTDGSQVHCKYTLPDSITLWKREFAFGCAYAFRACVDTLKRKRPAMYAGRVSDCITYCSTPVRPESFVERNPLLDLAQRGGVELVPGLSSHLA